MNPARRRPAIIAGACGYGRWPGNSLEGARGCLDAGVDGVEIDVHLTADGAVVLHHDYRLNPENARLDGVWIDEAGPPLRDRILADLRRFDLGCWREGTDGAADHVSWPHATPVRMATLPDLLAEMTRRGGQSEIYVEIKTSPQALKESSDFIGLTQAVIRDLETANYLAKSRIIAFDWRVLRLARAMRPSLALGHLSVPAALEKDVRRDASGDSPWTDGYDPRHHGGDILAAIQAHGGTCWSAHFREVTADHMARARNLGMTIAVWGVAKARHVEAMTALGVESITLADPLYAQP